MVLEEALRGLECGRPQLHLSVVIHPYFQPTPHGVGLGSAVVDACIFLDGFLQFLLDFCLRLAEDTLDDGFPGFWIAAGGVAALPAPVFTFSDIAFAVCSSFWHGINSFRQ